MHDEFFDDLRHNLRRQARERHHRIQAVAEFRREHAADRILILTHAGGALKTNRGFRHIGSARIGGHDQDHIAEIHIFAVVVRELSVIHHLQQDIVQILMRLFDFIEQQYRMRVLINRVRQKPALIEADIARRRTNQARHAMAFHIFGHVEADQFNAKRLRQLLGDFRLAHTRRA